MAGRGIGVKVFADLDMAALAAVVGQMKSAFAGAGREISGSMGTQQAAIRRLEADMINAANRAADAEIAAEKRAAEAILAQRRARNAELVDEDKRTLAQQRALLMAPIASKRADAADDRADAARAKATSLEEEHAAALANSANAATAAGVAYNRAGMLLTGGLAVGLGEGIKQAGEFDNKLQQMGAAVDESASQIKDLHDQLLLLGPQVGRSLDEMVGGAYMAAKANFRDTADQIKLVAVASQLAAVEGAPLDNTMKALTTSLNDFRQPAEQAAKVATMIKAAAGDAKVTLDEFAGSVHNLEPLFATMTKGDPSKGLMMLGQQNAMLAAVTQTGASADQSSQWLRNAVMHLGVGNPIKGQREAVGALGGSFDDMIRQLPDVGPIGVMSQMNDLIAKKLGPDGMVQLDKFYRNKDAIKLERTNYEQLSPQLKAIADDVQSGNVDSMMAVRKAANVGDQAGTFAQLMEAHKQLTGLDPLLKKFQGGEGSIAQLWNAMTGSQSGSIVASSLFGSDESRSRLNKFLMDQQMANPENGGKDVGGWSEVSQTLGVKTKELNASMQGLVTSVGQNLLPAFKSIVDHLKSISEFFKGHQGLLQGLIMLAETFAAIWAGSKIFNGISKLGDAFEGVITKLQNVGKVAEVTNGQLAAAGPAASRGAAGVETATVAEAGAQAKVTTAAGTASAALAAEGPAAMKGAAGVEAAAAQEVASENLVTSAAARAAGALSLGLGVAGAFLLPAIGVGLGAGAINDVTNPDDPSNGFNQANVANLTVPAGLPKPGSSDAEAAMAGGSSPAEKWVSSTNSKWDQAGRYAWLMNHPDAMNDPNFKPPADYGQNPGSGPGPTQMPNLPGYGQHWENGKGWVNDAAGLPNAVPPGDLGDGTYNPDYMGPGDTTLGGGKKGKKGKKSDDEVNAELQAMGISPDGTSSDPLFVTPTGMGGSEGGIPNAENPFSKFTHPNGLFGKNGVLGDLAGIMTTFLAEMALGNPLGKMMTGEVSPYAWWAGDVGRGGKNAKLIESNNRTANSLDRLREALASNDENSPQVRIALRNYQNAQLEEAQKQAKYGGFAPSGSAFGTRTPGGGTVGIPGSSSIGPGAEQYRGLATDIATQMGVNPKTWVPALLAQIQTESAGNPMSVNDHDSNGRGGTQTVEGLFNFLPSTFQGSGGHNIWDPSDQIRTAIRYGMGKPGSTAAQPQGFGYGQGWASGTPQIVPGSPSTNDDHLGMLPGGQVIGLAGGEGILNSGAAQLLGPDRINAINALGKGIPGYDGGAATIGPGGPSPDYSSLLTQMDPGQTTLGGGSKPPPPAAKPPPAAASAATGPAPGKGNGERPMSQVDSSQNPEDTGASKPGGGISGGGAIGMAEQAAVAAASMTPAGPAGGMAAQLLMQEMNRAAQFAGEAAATLVGEMPLETFGLTGNDLSGRSVNLAKSLPGKIIGGIAGAHANLPNNAGKADKALGQSMAPFQKSGDASAPEGGGDYTGVHVENMNFHNSDAGDVTNRLNQYAMSAHPTLDRSPTFP